MKPLINNYMEEKDLINLLESLPVPEQANSAHQRKLRVALLDSPVFQKDAPMFNFNKLAMSFALVLLVAAFAWFSFYKSSSNKQPIQQAQNSQTQKVAQTLPSQTEKWQTVTWHDPANTILGYKFDIPSTWTEIATSSERRIEVSSCPIDTHNCDRPLSLIITTASANQTTGYINNLTGGYVASEGGYSQSTTTVAGLPATLLSHPKFGNDKIIYLLKDNEWFVISFSSDEEADSLQLFNQIISTFAFTKAQANQAPAEYSLLKNIDKWALTYQLKSTAYSDVSMACTDGRKGNTSIGYMFNMSSDGFGEPPGDIDTPFNQVVQVLTENGWTDCGIPVKQQDPSNGTNRIFIKNNKLIGIFKHYSMGVGNSLRVAIQYDK